MAWGVFTAGGEQDNLAMKDIGKIKDKANVHCLKIYSTHVQVDSTCPGVKSM